MENMLICPICGHAIEDEKPVMYEGDQVHYKCAWDDIDSVGFDDFFGDN